MVAAFGALKCGGVLHPVNSALGAAELAYVLDHADPALVVVDAKAAENVARAAGPKRRLAAFDGAPGAIDVRAAIAAASAEPPPIAPPFRA